MKLNNIPNIITIGRIILVAPLLWLLVKGEYQSAFYIFVVAGLSDGLDGLLARRFDWTSRVGSILDPLADKLLMVGSFCVLAWISLIPIWLLSIVVARDALIMAAVPVAQRTLGNFDFEPRMLSKINTATQNLFIFVLLYQLAYAKLPAVITPMLMKIVLFTTIFSFLDYMMAWYMKASDKHNILYP